MFKIQFSSTRKQQRLTRTQEDDLNYMSEQKWLTCTEPGHLRNFLCKTRASQRKLLLADAAQWRSMLVPEWLRDESSQSPREIQESKAFERLVDVVERQADGKASPEEWRDVWDYWEIRKPEQLLWYKLSNYPNHCDLIRDIFGNPYRLVAFDSAWRTTNVAAVAQTIYDERRFCDMPILGDALEEAGCNQESVLDHCRSEEGHVRGCWVVDLALGRG
jgi:hypothetical protein